MKVKIGEVEFGVPYAGKEYHWWLWYIDCHIPALRLHSYDTFSTEAEALADLRATVKKLGGVVGE